MGLLLALLLAAPASHRANAAHAEALGHMQEAAREYQAAWSEEHAPDLLYRLGLVQRKLKRYALAREAFRAYLRDAPDGGLRDEVVRQLAKLEVLIEAQSEDYADPPAQPGRRGARTAPAQPSPPAASSSPPAAQPSPPAATSSPPPATSSPPAATSSPPAATSSPPAPFPSPPAPLPSPPAAPAAATPGSAFARELISAPAPPRSPVVPWLIGGAAAATAAGAYFWYDSTRLSRDLDARFASGDLSAADRPSYARVHRESIASRVLLGAAAALAAGAIALW